MRPTRNLGTATHTRSTIHFVSSTLTVWRCTDADGHGTTIQFDAKAQKIYVFSWDGDKITVKSYPAANKVAIHNPENKSGFANGPMTNGDHKVIDPNGATAHKGESSTGPYGSQGIVHVEPYTGVTGSTVEGAGLHSGRSGPDSLTYGCIRTTDEAMKDINATAKADPLVLINVTGNDDNIANWASRAQKAGATVDQTVLEEQTRNKTQSAEKKKEPN